MILEALSCGVPVVCYDLPPIREVYDTPAVVRCPVGDIGCVARKVLEILDNPSLGNKLSEKAISFSKNFSWDNSISKELDLLRKLVESH